MLFGLFGKKDEYEPKWLSYDKVVEGKTYKVTVDDGHTYLLDKKNYKNIIVVAFKSPKPDMYGMPTVEEQDKIDHAVQKIARELKSLTKSFYMGTIMGLGEVIAYFASVGAVDEAIVKEAADSAKVPYTVSSTVDEGWIFISTALFPTDKERQRAINTTMLSVVKKEQGEAAGAPIPKGAAHMLCFKNPADALATIEVLKPLGYVTIGTVQVNKGNDCPFFIEVEKDSTFDQATIDGQTDLLIDTVTAHNGRYDGWQALRGATVGSI